MDESEPFGRFNRAQRGVQNHLEQAGCAGLCVQKPQSCSIFIIPTRSLLSSLRDCHMGLGGLPHGLGVRSVWLCVPLDNGGSGFWLGHPPLLLGSRAHIHAPPGVFNRARQARMRCRAVWWHQAAQQIMIMYRSANRGFIGGRKV